MKRLACAIVLALAGCVGTASERATHPQSALSPYELIVILPTPDQLPFDPRSEQLAQATGELTAIVGHPVVFEIDAALVPEYRSDFEGQLVQSIENAARDLASLRKTSPKIFQRSASMLNRIVCRYQATARRPASVFDSAQGRLVITEAPQSKWIERGVVLSALEDEFVAFLDQQYRGKMPDQVPQAEWAAYFEFLTLTRPGFGNLSERTARNREQSDLDQLASHPHAETILRITRLAELLGSSSDPLALQVRSQLTDDAAWFLHTHETQKDRLGRIPENSTFRKSEAAWLGWLNGNLPSLSDAQRILIARAVFPARGRCNGSTCADLATSFPGFDRTSFGLGIVDQWRSDGRPTAGQGERFELEDLVVCPHFTREDGRRDRNRGCNAEFYRQALATDVTRARFAAEVSRRADPTFVDEIFVNSELVPPASVVAFFRALEPFPKEWQAASQSIVAQLLRNRDFASAMGEEAKRIWHDAPTRRGTALLILAVNEKDLDRHYGDPRWAKFQSDYGEAVSHNVFSSFLDQGPTALKLAPLIWPALATGFSRADLIVARLDLFMDDPGVRAMKDGEPNKTLRSIIGRICETKATQELSRLHAWMQQRARSHPNEATTLSTLLQDSAQCSLP